jgi:ferrous iron transport protein B
LPANKKHLVLVLAGNPNSGKTTIFNNLTGASQHIANYPGVTVERKEGNSEFNGFSIRFIDLPGIYSLSAYSIEEIIARSTIIDSRTDAVINIVDASNIERNLYLTTQIMELGTPIVIALNMADMAERRGLNIDMKLLSQLLGVPIVPTVGSKKKGMDELLRSAVSAATANRDQKHTLVNYGKEAEEEIARIVSILSEDSSVTNGFRPRWVALKLLENDVEVSKLVSKHGKAGRLVKTVRDAGDRLEQLFGEPAGPVMADRRYGFISGACSEAVKFTGQERHDVSDSIDRVLIHPLLGLPIFALFMWIMFHLTFTLAEKPMELIEAGVSWLSASAAATVGHGFIASLLVDGVIAGVGGVIVFLPNIMLLFLSIAVLEDTGYMARAAFVMDRVMHRIGLHGKSFIPMLIGFGCSVPAYMGSRILEDKADRLVTMHVTTFMSCGARLPVYVLVCGAFWPSNPGSVIFSVYALGVLTAVLFVRVLRSTRFKGMSAPFIMELPPYRVPTLRSLAIHMWERSWLYMRKAGTIILGIAVVMWFLMTFPEKKAFLKDYGSLSSAALAAAESGKMTQTEAENLVAQCDNARSAESIEYSFAGRLGRAMEPVIQPLGFDWRLGVAILSGFAAKEVVVSTMGNIYGVGDQGEESASLRQKLASDPAYSKLKAYAFLVFVLMYMPCMAALAVFLRESGSWRELAFQIGLTLCLAWFGAFAVYQGGKLFGLG